MDFKSEMREVLEKLYEEGNFEGEHRDIRPDRIEESLSSLLALIEKKFPKEKCFFKRDFTKVTDYEKAKLKEEGFNLCLSEIKKEMGI